MIEKFIMKSLEYNLAYNCNLKCYCCDHLSPYFNNPEDINHKNIDIEDFRRDIHTLKDTIFIESFLFLGGEPLLNKNILEFIKIVKESNIAKGFNN